MSDREKAIEIINRIPDSKIGYIVSFLRGFELDNDIEDDMFCEELYRAYLADESVDKHEAVSVEDFAAELGVLL